MAAFNVNFYLASIAATAAARQEAMAYTAGSSAAADTCRPGLYRCCCPRYWLTGSRQVLAAASSARWYFYGNEARQ